MLAHIAFDIAIFQTDVNGIVNVDKALNIFLFNMGQCHDGQFWLKQGAGEIDFPVFLVCHSGNGDPAVAVGFQRPFGSKSPEPHREPAWG